MTNSIIYGAGFAGLSAAIAASKYLDKILIIEPLDEELFNKITEADTRTTALSYFTKNLFEQNGLWGKLKPNCGEIEDIEIFDADYIKGDSPLNLHFSSDFVSSEPMGYIIENKNLKKALLTEIKKIKNIEIKFGTQISEVKNSPNKVVVKTSTGENIVTKLLVGADGKNSRLRDKIGIKTNKKEYGQKALTFNIHHENSHNKVAIERFMPTGPFAVLPMKNEHESSIVWTVEKDIADLYLKLNEGDLISEIQRRLNERLGDIKIISPILGYELSLTYTKQYFEGRCVLIGDAAHSIHPIAGQGFNQGVKDIAKLTQLIVEKVKLGLDFADESLLQKYENDRKSDNMQMILATDFFNSLFSNDNKIMKFGRRIGISAVNKTPKIRDFFIKKAMGQN